MINKHYIYFDWLLEWDLAGNGGRMRDRYEAATVEQMLKKLSGIEAWRFPRLYKLEPVTSAEVLG